MTGWVQRLRSERGASLVEFALLIPLLLLLIVGMVEFGYLFAQFNEVRHAAREGARYAAVSNPADYNGDSSADSSDVVAATCDALNLPGAPTVTAQVNRLGSAPTNGPTGGQAQREEYGSVTIEATPNPLTGVPLISDFVSGISLTNTATFRLEQDSTWANMNAPAACP